MKQSANRICDQSNKVARRSIGVQTDLRLAIQCACERATPEDGSAKSIVKISPSKNDATTIDVSNKKKNANPSGVHSTLKQETVGNNPSDTPCENSKTQAKHRSKRRGKQKSSRKGCDETACVDTHDRQPPQSPTANDGGKLSQGKGSADSDKSNCDHGNKANRNKDAASSRLAQGSERKIGQSTASSKLLDKRLPEQSNKVTSGLHRSLGVNNCSERNINANVQARPVPSNKKEQSQAQSQASLTAHRRPTALSPPLEQPDQKHRPDTANRSVDVQPNQSKPSHGRNKGSQPPREFRVTTPLTLVNQNDEHKRGNGGGRNIIYLTNRDQYELRAKLLIDAVPFRMPGS